MDFGQFPLGAFEVDCDGSACGSATTGRHIHPPQSILPAAARVVVRNGQRMGYSEAEGITRLTLPVGPQPDMIHVGKVSPGVTILINDSGQFVLRSGSGDVEVDGAELVAAVNRASQIAALVARSETPISGMSAPVERMLAKFGCRRHVED